MEKGLILAEFLAANLKNKSRESFSQIIEHPRIQELIKDNGKWILEHWDDEVVIDFSEPLEFSDLFDLETHKLYGSSGEERGAKHLSTSCTPGKTKLCGTRCISIDRKCKHDTNHSTVESQKFSVRQTMGLSNSLPKELRDKMVKKFPKVFENPTYEKFFWHLMYSSHSTEKGTVLIPREVIYRFSKDRNGEAFIREFGEAMGETRNGRPYFNYKDYSYKYNRAREADFDIGLSLKKKFKEDLKKPYHSDNNRVFALSGAPYNAENREKLQQIQRIMALQVASSLDNIDQRKIAFYHANQTINDLPRMRFKNAYAMAEQLREEKGDDSIDNAYMILNAIRSNRVGYYRPSKVTTRMFSAKHLQGLSSDVRAALIPEMAEMDLVSCHMAIIGDIMDSKEIKDMMKRKLTDPNYSVWEDDFAPEFEKRGYKWDKKTKALVKVQLYSLCYGGSKGGVTRRINEAGRDDPALAHALDPEFKEALYAVKPFRALSEVGAQWRDKLVKDGKGCNAYGVCFPVNDSKDARSVAAAVAQSYETKLVVAAAYPRYEDGELPKDLDWEVVYNGHDGVGIIPKKPYDLKHCQKIMKRRMQRIKDEFNLESLDLEIKMGSEVAADEDLLDPDLIRALEAQGIAL